MVFKKRNDGNNTRGRNVDGKFILPDGESVAGLVSGNRSGAALLLLNESWQT